MNAIGIAVIDEMSSSARLVESYHSSQYPVSVVHVLTHC